MANDHRKATVTDHNENLREILTLEQLDTRLFRSTFLFEERFPIFGGQVAAQALVAAGRTVGKGRSPHSIHIYFLRGGDSNKAVIYSVEADFDGGSFSSRRVVARQDGEVIFNASVSFHTGNPGPDSQQIEPHDIGAVEDTCEWSARRLHSIEMRGPFQPDGEERWPQYFYARVTADLGDDPLLHAAGLTYLTDGGTGFAALRSPDIGFLSSIDHVVWIHRISDISQWHLFNFEPHRTGGGRGLFTGSVFDTDGYLEASFAQECLFRYQKKR